MKGIQVFGPKHMRMVDMPMPERESGQLLIRSEYLSICGSDMRTFRYAFPEENYPLAPAMPCHECVGIVEQSGLGGGAGRDAGHRAEHRARRTRRQLRHGCGVCALRGRTWSSPCRTAPTPLPTSCVSPSVQ